MSKEQRTINLLVFWLLCAPLCGVLTVYFDTPYIILAWSGVAILFGILTWKWGDEIPFW